MKKIIVLGILLILAPFTIAQNLKPAAEGEVNFEIKNAGLKVNGSFGLPEVAIDFDPERPAEGKIIARVSVASIQTGIALRDKHLKKEEYFDEPKYPIILMESKTLQKNPTGGYTGLFTLRLKDTEKEVEVPFAYQETEGKATYSGTFTINRLDYQVGQKSWFLADEVKVSLSVTVLIKKPE